MRWLTNFETKLVKLALDVAEDSAFELFSLGENFFHSHARDKHTSFALNDTLDNVLKVLIGIGLRRVRIGKEHGIFHQRIATVLILSVLCRGIMSRAVGTTSIDITSRGFQLVSRDIYHEQLLCLCVSGGRLTGQR